jgi:hypothetical protein
MFSQQPKHPKHAPTSTIPEPSCHSTVEEFLEAVFSMQSMLRLYNEDVTKIWSWAPDGA